MPQDTKLFYRTYPGGPALVVDKGVSTGEFFWVDSGTGSDAVGYGTDPASPTATIDYAVGLCTANSGDTIYVMEGHTEDLAAAADLACDIAGVRIIGLGDKDNRPIISFTTIDSADIDIDAADITFENISFRCDIASLLAAIDVNASGFTIRNCSFMGTDAADEAFLISIITDAAADDITIEDCQFHYLNAEDGTAITTTSTECIRLVGADRAKIRRNYISGDFTTSAINGITTTSDDILILNNIIQNIATENITGGIDLEASTTGFLDGNMLYVDDPTDPEDAIDDGACAIGVNWVTNAIGTAPIIWGSAGSGGVEGKIDIIDGYHDVPTADTTDDAQMRDVIGKKDDAAQETVGTTRSLVGITKGINTILVVPTADTTDDAHISDVVGKKDDAAQETVGTTRSLVGITKGINTILGVPAADTTDDVHTSDVIGKKDDAAQETVGTTRSLVGITKGINTILGVPAADTTDDVHVSDVAGKKDDAAVQTAGTTKSILAYAKGAIDALSGTSGIATWATAAAAANGVSLSEAFRWLSEKQTPRIVQHEVTFTDVGDGAVGAIDLFTVTGTVKARIVAICTTVTTIQAGATIEVGIAGATATIIAQTAGDAPDANEIWHDATPDASIELDSVAAFNIITNSNNIIQTIATDTIDSGVMMYYCEYIPVSTDGAVVAA